MREETKISEEDVNQWKSFAGEECAREWGNVSGNIVHIVALMSGTGGECNESAIGIFQTRLDEKKRLDPAHRSARESVTETGIATGLERETFVAT